MYLLDALDDILPAVTEPKNPEEQRQYEEERRLFYVAMTRAKDRLHVAAVRERYHRKTDVSRFIEEAGL